MAPRVLIFLIAMGADYSFELNSIDTEAPTMGQLQDNFRNSFIDSFRDNSVDNFLPIDELETWLSEHLGQFSWSSEKILTVPYRPIVE